MPALPRRAAAGLAAAASVLLLTACGITAAGPATAPSSPPSPTTAPTASPAAGGIAGTVWVADEADGTLTAIDATTHEVVATVAGVPAPHNVQTSPDGVTVWAVSGTSSALVALDARTLELRGTAPTGVGPAHVVVSPDGASVYVTNSGDDSLTRFDAAEPTPAGSLPVSAGPHGLRFSPDGSTLVVASTTADAVDVIDTATFTRAATIPVGDAPVQVAVGTGVAYVSLSGASAVAEVDLAVGRVARIVDVQSPPVQLYLTPDGTRLLSADQGSAEAPGSTVTVIDTRTMTVESTIGTGSGPHGVVVAPDGDLAWVTNLYDDTVSVLDLASGRAVATVDVGGSPNGISFTPVTVRASAAEPFLDVPVYGTGADHDSDGHSHG